MALFGEKYGDEVRVVEVDDYAREWCGGTHVARSGQLGRVKTLNEASIGAGVRRVEALVGIDAFGFLAKEHLLVSPFVGTEAPEGAAGNDVRTLAQEIRGKIDAGRPAVVAVAARANGKASSIVAVNAVAKSRGAQRRAPWIGYCGASRLSHNVEAALFMKSANTRLNHSRSLTFPSPQHRGLPSRWRS